MRLKINTKELVSAGLMIAIGVATVAGSLNYDIRTLARMGPGYFPLLLGAILIVIGALILITPSTEIDEDLGRNKGKPEYRAWGFVVLGVVLFAVLGHYTGLVPATFALVLVSALGDRSNSLMAASALALGITVMAVAIFHYGLQMQFPLFIWG